MMIGRVMEQLAIGAIRGYQYTFSLLIGPSCRYQPTCSEYAATAIHRFGVIKGTWMGLRRIGRCHPWGGSGYDPVPTEDQ